MIGLALLAPGIAPAGPGTKRLPRHKRALLDAANLIEKYGWARGTLGSKEEGFCVNGAVLKVVTGRARPYVGGPFDSLFPWSKRQTLINALKLLDDHTPHNPFYLIKSMSTYSPHAALWNDHTAKTKEQVVDYLRKAALS